MTILVVQSNKAIAAFSWRTRSGLTTAALAKAARLAQEAPSCEIGYYDVLLLDRPISAAQFSEYALTVPRGVYAAAYDHVIEIK